MFKYFKWIFGKAKTDYAQLLKDGALVIDVRTIDEYKRGHMKGSINIPVDQLSHNLNKLSNKNRPIITCCASGIRSASARSILISKGYSAVYNGGRWNSLQDKLEA